MEDKTRFLEQLFLFMGVVPSFPPPHATASVILPKIIAGATEYLNYCNSGFSQIIGPADEWPTSLAELPTVYNSSLKC